MMAANDRARPFRLMGLALAFAVPMAATPALGDVRPGALTNEADANLLATAIERDLKRLPCTASAEDLEAAIFYRVSQSNVSTATAATVLARIAQINSCNPNLAAALGQVRVALVDQRFRRGTAAVNSGGFGNGGAGFGSSFFTSPIVNVGGGTSNYRN